MIGTRIKQIRRTLGIRQKDFADRLGLSQSYLSELEGGKTPSDIVIKSISSQYHVSETWLRTGDGEMYERPELDEVIASYDFPDIVRRLLETYETLSQEQQEAVLEYARRFIQSLADAPAQPTIEERVEAYRRELEAEEAAKKGRSSPSPGTDSAG